MWGFSKLLAWLVKINLPSKVLIRKYWVPADEFDGKISDLSLHVLLGHLKEFFGKVDPVNIKTWITYM